jgi:hypothetical protein
MVAIARRRFLDIRPRDSFLIVVFILCAYAKSLQGIHSSIIRTIFEILLRCDISGFCCHRYLFETRNGGAFLETWPRRHTSEGLCSNGTSSGSTDFVARLSAMTNPFAVSLGRPIIQWRKFPDPSPASRVPQAAPTFMLWNTGVRVPIFKYSAGMNSSRVDASITTRDVSFLCSNHSGSGRYTQNRAITCEKISQNEFSNRGNYQLAFANLMGYRRDW